MEKSGPTARVLVVDHEKELYDILLSMASDSWIDAAHALTLQEGIRRNSASSFDIVLMRDRLPDGAACDVIPTVFDVSCPPELIVYTNKGDPDEMERIIKSGGWDYVIRPHTSDKLLQLIRRAILYRREKFENGRQGSSLTNNEVQSEGIIGSSQILQQCLNLVAKAAQTDANVLITGESGTGKELFASAIHNISRRADQPFVVVDCAALPEALVESILFGHERGAFTSADKSRQGLIKQADGGTLFLDEVGELPLDIQKKFLRVLQERVFRPIGSQVEIRSNFRLIAATNRNLQDLSSEKRFREDLLFRLRAFHLELPPLRARMGDITELAYYFREQYSRRWKEKEKNFSTDFLMVLKEYDWPGNVRELFHAMERAIAAAQESETLFPVHLPTEIRIRATRRILELRGSQKSENFHGVESESNNTPPPLQQIRERAIATAEEDYLRRLVELTAGDLKKSLKISDLSRSRLYALLKKYNIPFQKTA
jgi:two-component system NtrC family response regulator